MNNDNQSEPSQTTPAEQDLRASEVSYRRLFEAAKDGILILNVDTGRITDVNPFLVKLLGFSRKEMIGKTVAELSPFKDIESNQKMLKRLQEHKYVRYENLPLETRDGRHIAVEFVSNVYQSGDRKVIQCNVRDITERKKTEERMNQLHKEADEARVMAEEANQVKSRFLANMSHELRTPMGVVIGLSNILAMSRPLTKKQIEYVKTLQLSAGSLLTLINDLLDVSKIDSGVVVLEEVPFSLGKLLEEVASMMSVRANEKHLGFTIDDQSVKGTRFLGDPTRLRQILLNLCGNAIKFTERGSIHVSVKSHPIDDDRFDISIAVSDTGIGIAPEKIAFVFDRFVQAETSMTRRYGGTGLGLTISKTLVELMYGTIHVESVPDQGSVFIVEIPLRLAPNSQPEENEEEAQPTPLISNARVLLVEDHEPNILVESTYLDLMGLECDVARDGEEALKMFALRKYDLILLDVQMPIMNGLEVTHHIRSQEKLKGLPRTSIIGMTAYALAGDRQSCLAAGMDEYIPKPFEPEELRSKVLVFVDKQWPNPQ